MTQFTLDEANSLIPELRRLLTRAREELAGAYQELKRANSELIDREWALRQAKIDGVLGDKTIDDLQQDWQKAADDLEATKNAFEQLQDLWLQRIGALGVVLRDLQRGLVDFPATLGNAEFYYCWTIDEEEITHWHSREEGYANRKPLAALSNWDWSDRAS